jgi:hypothetical protein
VINVLNAASTAEGDRTLKTFTIDAENNIIAHASRKAARESGAGVFATEEQFAELIGPDSKRLIEIWNSIPGVKPVTKFNSRKTATERIWKSIQSLGIPDVTAGDESEEGAPVAPQPPDVAPEGAPAKTRATRTKKAPRAAAAASSRPRAGSKVSRVIELLKREGGISLKELVTEMGWQQHTTRALISAGGALAKKHGLTLVSAKGENGDRIYSIQA